MRLLTLIPYYLAWHYTRAIADLISIWGNLIWFTTNHFSFGVLFRTLFSPFKRLNEKYPGGINFGKLFEVVVINILMRIVGFCLRIVVILVGLAALIVVIGLGLVSLVIWIIAPFLIVFLFIAGLIAIIKA